MDGWQASRHPTIQHPACTHVRACDHTKGAPTEHTAHKRTRRHAYPYAHARTTWLNVPRSRPCTDLFNLHPWELPVQLGEALLTFQLCGLDALLPDLPQPSRHRHPINLQHRTHPSAINRSIKQPTTQPSKQPHQPASHIEQRGRSQQPSVTCLRCRVVCSS